MIGGTQKSVISGHTVETDRKRKMRRAKTVVKNKTVPTIKFHRQTSPRGLVNTSPHK